MDPTDGHDARPVENDQPFELLASALPREIAHSQVRVTGGNVESAIGASEEGPVGPRRSGEQPKMTAARSTQWRSRRNVLAMDTSF
jgi:hypothetical protein